MEIIFWFLDGRERDKKKETISKKNDIKKIYITDDNPRKESPKKQK